MRNSALQPSASRDTLTSHTASQLSSFSVSLYQYRSCLTPAGFTANSYAVRRSWYESIRTLIQSDGDSSSRRGGGAANRAGLGWEARAWAKSGAASVTTRDAGPRGGLPPPFWPP